MADRDQSSSLLCISSSFLVGIVHHLICQPLGYGGDRAYADSKHVFAFTSLLVPRIAKSWAGAWEGGWLDEVGQLLYEVYLLTASGGVAGGHKFSWKIVDMRFDNNNVSRFPTLQLSSLLWFHHLIRDA